MAKVKKAAPVVDEDEEQGEDEEKPKKAKKAPRKTIMNLARQIFTDFPTIDAQTFIDAILEEFPNSACNKAHYAWYRNHFRKEGLEIPTKRKAKVQTEETEEEEDESLPPPPPIAKGKKRKVVRPPVEEEEEDEEEEEEE